MTEKGKDTGKKENANALYDVMHGSGKAFGDILARVRKGKGGKK